MGAFQMCHTSIGAFGEIEGRAFVLISIHVHYILDSQRDIWLHRERIWKTSVRTETKGSQSVSVGRECSEERWGCESENTPYTSGARETSALSIISVNPSEVEWFG